MQHGPWRHRWAVARPDPSDGLPRNRRRWRESGWSSSHPQIITHRNIGGLQCWRFPRVRARLEAPACSFAGSPIYRRPSPSSICGGPAQCTGAARTRAKCDARGALRRWPSGAPWCKPNGTDQTAAAQSLSLCCFIPLLCGKETVGQLERVTEGLSTEPRTEPIRATLG